MKNEGNGKTALYKLIEKENISETFVSQFLRYVMDLFPILLKNKNECYAVQTRSQLKDLKNINNNKNEVNIKIRLIRNVEVTNEVQKKRGRPRNIIQEVKLQEPIKRRGRPRKNIQINHLKFTENKNLWNQKTNPILIQTMILTLRYQTLEDFPLRVRTFAVLPNVATTWLNM